MRDFFELSAGDQEDLLETAAQTLGRPAYVLEKDIYVVWVLGAIFSAPIGDHITFKGGTSLSKVYRLIDRFSEDLDLTYDVRQMLQRAESEIPESSSQARRWTEEVRKQLPVWIEQMASNWIWNRKVTSSTSTTLPARRRAHTSNHESC